MKVFIRATSVSLAAFSVALAGSLSVAQAAPDAQGPDETSLEEVVVTAAKREQSLQDVPIAVTAISAATLAQAQITAAVDLPRLTPNLAVLGSVGNYVAPYLRGVGTTYNTPGLEPSVPVYLDDVFVARASAAMCRSRMRWVLLI